MRYEDWDVLLFPQECGTPVKEFSVACRVVHDAEFATSHGSFGLPTVFCFVPSLAAGTPFKISMHSWNTPTISQFTKAYTKFPEDVVFEARLFVDGRLVASTSFSRHCSWPHLITNSFDFSKNGDLEPLRFPLFHQELLEQNSWSLADDFGRIKIVVSEGFPRDSSSLPIERVKNIVAFSFQHAPLEVLESSSIAWPNPNMWHRAPLIGSMPVPSYPSKDIKSHAHSPRRRTGVRPAADNVFAMRNAVSNHMQNSFGHFSPYLNGHTSSYNGFFDDFDRSKPTLNWTENIESNVDNAHHQFSTGVAKPRCQRQTNTDTSMPDYECSNPEGSVSMSTGDDFTTASFQIDEINLGSHHAPNNTPISVQQNSWEFGQPFPVFSGDTAIPADLANSLTASLLNQSFGLQKQTHRPQVHHVDVSTPNVRSRKENRVRHATCPVPLAAPLNISKNADRVEQRKVSQQLFIPPGGSIPTSLTELQAQTGGDEECLDFESHPSWEGQLGNNMASTMAQNSSLALGTPVGSEKGTKRARHPSPDSARTLDEDDEGDQRLSSRARLTPVVSITNATHADGLQ